MQKEKRFCYLCTRTSSCYVELYLYANLPILGNSWIIWQAMMWGFIFVSNTYKKNLTDFLIFFLKFLTFWVLWSVLPIPLDHLGITVGLSGITLCGPILILQRLLFILDESIILSKIGWFCSFLFWGLHTIIFLLWMSSTLISLWQFFCF